MRRTAIFVLPVLATLMAVASIALLATLATLAPGSTAWTLPLRTTAFGQTLQREVSVPVLLRLATHPLAALAIDGRAVDTAQGRWQLAAGSSDGVVATCAPCRLSLAALGPAPLSLDRVQLAIRADGADQYHGTLRLSAGPSALALSWRGQIDRGGRMQSRRARHRAGSDGERSRHDRRGRARAGGAARCRH